MADSEFSIEFINKTFNVDPDQNLSEEQKAMAYAMQIMIEEHTYWYGNRTVVVLFGFEGFSV